MSAQATERPMVDVCGHRMFGGSGSFRRERCPSNCSRANLVRRMRGNGVSAIVLQCSGCGNEMRAVARADVAEAERAGVRVGEWNELLVIEHEERLTSASNSWRDKKEEERREWRERYEDHLRSPKWRAICRQVRDRDGNVCRGCLSAPADCVHHLTYEHMGDELLFELISLCDACHARIHPHMLGDNE